MSDYLGFPLPVTPADRQFFGDNRLLRSSYINSSGTRIDLLSVGVTGSIHSIHPAEICLKSGGNEVLSSRELKIDTKFGPLACQELVVQPKNSGQKLLILVWYTNERWSSGNFLSFRRHWKPGSIWHTFQLSIPIATTPDEALLRLEDFLNSGIRKLPEEKTGQPQ